MFLASFSDELVKLADYVEPSKYHDPYVPPTALAAQRYAATGTKTFNPKPSLQAKPVKPKKYVPPDDYVPPNAKAAQLYAATGKKTPAPTQVAKTKLRQPPAPPRR
jgi:hypothetical protein